MPKRGPLRGPPKKPRLDTGRRGGGSKDTPAAKGAPANLEWDEDVESSEDSDEEMANKKAKRAEAEEEADEEDEDPEEHRKR